MRGCEDRDLSGEGWVTEEAFFAVLKDQGILQQLGWVLQHCFGITLYSHRIMKYT